MVGLSVKAPLHRDYLLISPSKHIWKLDRLCNVLYAVHSAWCDSQRNSFLGCHQPIVKTNYDLAGSSQSILYRLVVVVEPDCRYGTDFAKVNPNCMIFTSIEWDKPHVSVIGRVVFTIEKLLKCAVI